MGNKDCPCMNCTRRNVGCHANCEDYLGWHKKQQEISNQIYNSTINDIKYSVHKRDVCEKANKRHKR